MRKLGSIFLGASLLLTSVMIPMANVSAATITSSDYQVALKDSIMFYDANKCGKDVAKDNVFSWRGACHTSDGSPEGIDLTGGFHDAGDHIKFGITQGYAASILGWSYYEMKDVYAATGQSTKTLSTLKYFTDFFLKSKVGSKLYFHVGEPADHDYWGSPEAQTGARSAKYSVPSMPASDVCGLYAASLAQMYLNYNSIDSTYAKQCLAAAKEIYTMGKATKGVGKADGFYTSSAWEDDMAWGALWLYIAEKDNTYLSDVNSFLPSPGTNWAICWNDMKLAVACVAAKVTGESKYKDAVASNLNYWKNSIPKTPGGLRVLNSWGTLRYSAAAALLAIMYYGQTNDESLKTFAKSQIDYIMGNNPANMSYIVGFGSNYPKHPHHRAASGWQGWTDWKNPAKNVLTGALVGGPDMSDAYTDLTDKYECTEVAIDYNAGLVGALAGMAKYYGNITINTPPPTTPPTPTPTPSTSLGVKGDFDGDGVVSMADIMLMAARFGYVRGNSMYDQKYDFNNDSAINMSDLMSLAALFGSRS